MYEDWKLKISVLWLVAELSAIVGNVLELYEPGVIEGLIDGELAGMQVTPEMMLVLAILFLIGPIMAFLSLTLKDSINRWANIIVGAVFFGFTLLTIGEYLTIQSAYSASKILIEVVGLVFIALIVWYAWKSKHT
jgi:hypothetical protein